MKFHTVLIDLDETLYPKANGVWGEISTRINEFIVDCLEVSMRDAIEIRQRYLNQYGTTLMGLSVDHNIDRYQYLEYVHDIPIDKYLRPAPNLRDMLNQITARKVIFTNASADHADRVLQHLEIQESIDQVIDIVALDFINKPQVDAYQKAIQLAEIHDPTRAIMVDDRLDNLLPARNLKFRTVLVADGIKSKQVDYQIASITDLVDAVPALASA
jgi:putative hydrolase of the HAD superfamily